MFDVDPTTAQKQLTLGLRIVSFLGAVALSAAVFFFFYRFWGVKSSAAKVAVLVAVPMLCTFGVEIAARKEKTLYFASLASSKRRKRNGLLADGHENKNLNTCYGSSMTSDARTIETVQGIRHAPVGGGGGRVSATGGGGVGPAGIQVSDKAT